MSAWVTTLTICSFQDLPASTHAHPPVRPNADVGVVVPLVNGLQDTDHRRSFSTSIAIHEQRKTGKLVGGQRDMSAIKTLTNEYLGL